MHSQLRLSLLMTAGEADANAAEQHEADDHDQIHGRIGAITRLCAAIILVVAEVVSRVAVCQIVAAIGVENITTMSLSPFMMR